MKRSGAIIVPERLKRKLYWMTLITWHLTEGCFHSDMAVVHVEGLTTPWPHLGTFLPTWGRFCVWVLLLESATALRVTFWVPTHAPNHLVTYFESVSAFLSYPAPGYPGRDLPLESYLSQRRLWGGRGTSQVRLPYTGVVTMALKPPFSSLYHSPGSSGPEALPRHRSLHGLSYPWVSGNHTVITLP